ncbi:non-specific lipid-transfer protein 1 [Arachis duranensis]|uniref:Non-specific lipid-transfer protein n=1 Tax=Arachis duranensis TaxID=130453 RepID=A0A6P4D301_ARADU|nr:non-specific lipid-transfer protein 1 [Arachis duranensis]
MASSTMLFKVACLAMVCMVLNTSMANGALTCAQITFTASPCIAYIRNPGAAVPAQCCNGLRSLNDQCKATPERQAACRCLKSTVLNVPGVNLPALAGLPNKCGINLPYKVTPAIDCNTYIT